ncbi:MAG: hypothetical protein Q9213_002300 [Squamulea squamosa]
MTPEEHHQEFLHQAKRLGIKTEDRLVKDIAVDLINAPVEAIRSLEYVGAPCAPSELTPQADWATMRHARHTKPNQWLKSQIMCSSTYDGSISHLVAKSQERTQLAQIFIAICKARLKNPQKILELYEITEDIGDDVALEKICQIVTDIGYYGAAVSALQGAAESSETKSYNVLFDIGNPFTDVLEKGRFATHTWDVVSLLGAYDAILPSDLRHGVCKWRELILEYCHTGELPCRPWQPTSQSTLLVQKEGISELSQHQLAESKRLRLLDFAKQEGGECGFDLLWEDVVRFFLKTGNPRYAHEVAELVSKP